MIYSIPVLLNHGQRYWHRIVQYGLTRNLQDHNMYKNLTWAHISLYNSQSPLLKHCVCCDVIAVHYSSQLSSLDPVHIA